MYEPADTSFIVNDGDPDLKPIRISLPRPPRLSLIAGYGKKKEDQRFERVDIPLRLKQLEKKVIDNLNKRASENKQFIITYYNVSKEFWDILDQEREYYEEEIQFIKKMWWHRLYGYWFFNRGKPTYITGWHFMYLNFWYMPTVPGGHPEYRDRDRREFLFHQYAYTTTETFERLDSNGWAVPEDDGTYKIIDTGRRICFGLSQPKNRRSGNTNKGLNNCFEINSRSLGGDGMGIMSYTGKSAQKHYEGKMVPAWNKFPLFFRPFSTSKSSPASIKFNTPSNDFNNTGLGNSVTYAESSNAKFYDGQWLWAVLTDEEGKCFTRGVKVRMYDGSVKNIEDVVVGDQLMGDDSMPRNVLSLGRGHGQCYMIHPKKGKSWGCNDNHILSLYSCYKSDPDTYRKYIDVSIQEYFNFSKTQKKHSVLYRVPVEYSHQDVLIDPYYFGVWLGDGSSYDSVIYTIDSEVIDYVKKYADAVDGIYFEKECKNRISGHSVRFNETVCRSTNRPNRIIRGLKSYGVFGNKHIPMDYLRNSTDVRLNVLAGIIDSDGYRQARDGNSQKYEVTTKIKKLADGINELCLGLGFWCSVNEKNATMKRLDGSVYGCLVYRISIYGDLYKIPCKIKRKKYGPPSMHKNRRNPRHFGFRIEDIGNQDYYGIVIDGNRRFLLQDCTVVHNTTETDVDERNRVITNCLSQGDGRIIHGYKYSPSTVEEYTQGGAAFKAMMNQSSFYQRVKASGQTPSGLFRIFMSAEEGLDGFIDSYGFSVRGELMQHQAEEGFTETADEYLTGIKDHHLAQDTPESKAAYLSECKLFPQFWKHCWIGDSGEIGFDSVKIDEQLANIRRITVQDQSPVITGNFEWRGDVFGADVIFEPDSDGRFNISDLAKDRANQRIRDLVWDFIDDMEKEVWAPLDPSWATAGADAFKFKKKAEVKQSYSKHGMSDGGFCVLREYDARIDGDKPRSEWETENLVCTYRFRPKTDDEFCEDVLKACIWYGIQCYPEMNLPVVAKKFREWGYAGYLKHDILPDGRIKEEPGTHLHRESKQEGFSFARNFINYRCHKIVHADFLMECKQISNMEDLQNYDLLASVICALIGSKSSHSKIMQKINMAEINVAGLWNKYSY